MSFNRTVDTEIEEHKQTAHLTAKDRSEMTRPKRMGPRRVLHETETETEAETNYCETESQKWSRLCDVCSADSSGQMEGQLSLPSPRGQ